jgi:hypothetical protein
MRCAPDCAGGDTPKRVLALIYSPDNPGSVLALGRLAHRVVSRTHRGGRGQAPPAVGLPKAGDLPVEQPTKLDMVINLKTATARADQVID